MAIQLGAWEKETSGLAGIAHPWPHWGNSLLSLFNEQLL
jgi:hypothetical protein